MKSKIEFKPAEAKHVESAKAGPAARKTGAVPVKPVANAKQKKAAKSAEKQKNRAKAASKAAKKGSDERVKQIKSEFKHDPYSIIRFVNMTEKSVRIIELQNSLVFVVNRKFGKSDIEKAVITAFEKDVASVRTHIDQKGRKKAFVRFADEGAAGDIAVRLGII